MKKWAVVLISVIFLGFGAAEACPPVEPVEPPCVDIDIGGQTQMQKVEQKIGDIGNSKVNVVAEGDQRELPAVAPPIIPNTIPILPGGVSNITAGLPKFSVKPLATNDEVVDVVYYNGWWLDRICLDELELEILKKYQKVLDEKKWETDKIRYAVWQKDSVVGSGTSGGLTGIISSVNGSTGSGGGASLLPGTNRSTADPMYTVKFFLIR